MGDDNGNGICFCGGFIFGIAVTLIGVWACFHLRVV